MFQIGDVVESIYTGDEGIVLCRAFSEACQDFYLVRWNKNGKQEIMAREDLLF